MYDKDVVEWWNKALQNTQILSGDWKDTVSYVEDKELLNRTQLAYFKRRMEKLRDSNDRLRDGGIYWYEEVKKILDK